MRYWTEEEDMFIKEHASEYTYPQLAKKLNRTLSATMQRCSKLKSFCRKKGYEFREWTPEEVNYLVDSKDKPLEFVAKKINRTLGSVTYKKRSLGLMDAHHYAEAEDEYLKKYYGIKTVKQLAIDLDREENAIRKKALRLGINCMQNDWTPEREQFLKDNYTKMTNEELAKQLGEEFTAAAVMGKAHLMGLRAHARRKFTEEDDQFILDNAGKMTWTDIGKVLGRKGCIISSHYRRMKK